MTLTGQTRAGCDFPMHGPANHNEKKTTVFRQIVPNSIEVHIQLHVFDHKSSLF